MARTNLNAYRSASISASSPEDTLLLLVNEAVRSAESSRLEQNVAARRRQIDKSRRIVAELSNTLNMDYGGEMAFNMLRLYMFINRRLTDALSGDEEGLPEALRILRHVRDTWVAAVEIVRAERGES